jgi:linoleoyl-CoA desaturase
MSSLKFSGNHSAYYLELKHRVESYFAENKIQMHGDSRNVIKSTVLLTVFLACYILLAFAIVPGWWALPVCVLFGVVTAGIGFNIMHDGGHGSLSANPTLNKLAALSLNLLGGSSFFWNIKHNVIHHTYTNIDDHDDDILIEPFFRMTQAQKKIGIHRWQYLYWPLAYGTMYLAWVFVLDFKKYFSRQIGQRDNIKLPLRMHIGFWLTKILYVVFYVVLPLQFHSPGAFLLGFGVYTFTTGLIISVVFQLAHAVEEVNFIIPEADQHHLDTDWATHQLRTTANFATGNRIVSWFTGGLNHQVEHHLFPRISHVHYDAISPIVREVSAQHGLPYYETPTLGHAILSHIRFLRRMGR